VSNKNVKEFTIKLAPNIELEQYERVKPEVSATFTGTTSKKLALKTVELMWWEALGVELKMEMDVQESYKEKGTKSLRKLVQKKIEKNTALIHKYTNT